MPTPFGYEFRKLVEAFNEAAKHQERPRFSLTSQLGRKVRLVRARPAHTCNGDRAGADGSVFVYVDNDFAAAIHGGDFRARIRREVDERHPGLRDFLRRLDQDFAGTVGRLGRESGTCQFCNRALRDERSTRAGYGPTCAQRWGLPWGGEEGGES